MFTYRGISDRRARELPGTYRCPLEKLDREVRGTLILEKLELWWPGCRVFGSFFAWSLVPAGIVPKIFILHALIQTCAESKVDHLCRSTGRSELESQLSVVVSQCRRLLSTTIVKAQAQCLLSRIGVITPQAGDAARRREVAGRMERQMREERRANWMASLAGLGSARREKFRTLI